MTRHEAQDGLQPDWAISSAVDPTEIVVGGTEKHRDIEKKAPYSDGSSDEKTVPSAEFDIESPEVDELGDTLIHHAADKDDILTHTIHVEDDPNLQAITFRSMFIGTPPSWPARLIVGFAASLFLLCFLWV